jgi:hypothetical protein
MRMAHPMIVEAGEPFPHRIALEPDGYLAKHVGRLSDGRQVVLTEPFIPAIGNESGREFCATYLFDSQGTLVTAHIDDLGPRSQLDAEQARNIRNRRLADLGAITSSRIEIWPFVVEAFGVTFGLIPRPPDEAAEASDFDSWWVEVQPGNYMAFHAPWDSGEYDT